MSLPLYFWGADVRGKVVASPASTFRELVATHINIPVSLPVTSGDFHTAAVAEKRRIKEQLPYLVPAVFPASPSSRKFEHALHCNLIFLDIDTEKDGTCPAAPFVKNPGALSRQLSPFAFSAYTTISSTPEKPRLRVMVRADKLPLDRYPDAVRTIAARIGLGVVTPESLTAVQPMFLPCIFAGQWVDLEHPSIAEDLDGEPFTIRDIDDDVDDLAEPRAKGHTEDEVNGRGDDALKYLRPPVQEVTLNVAREALATMDADMPYPEWFEMAAALKHQFSPKKAERAFELFNEWSAGGSKYAGGDATLDKWNSIRPTPVGRVPVTIRSLLHKAVEHGWKSHKVKEECFKNTMEWVRDENRSQTELMAESLRRIAATPLISHTEEDALLNAVVLQARKAHGLTISISSLRKDLKKLKDQAGVKDKDEKAEAPPWLKGWCFVSKENEFFRHSTSEKLAPDAFNNAFGPKLAPTEEELESLGLDPTPANLGKPFMRPQDFALNLHKVMVVYDYEYNPAKPNKLFTKSEGRYYINTYRKSYPEASPDNAAEAEQVFMAHLNLLVAEEEYRRHVLDWMAYNVQYPGRKIRHAILLQGGEGCGKSYLFDVLRTVLGKTNVRKVNKSTLDRGWTEWAVGSQVVAVEEIRVVGHNRHDVMNTLKELVTNDDVPVNERNKATVTAANITNYLLFSNFHDALALSEGDRRYFVLKSPLQCRKDILKLEATGHFSMIFDMLNENASGLRHFFENHAISDSFNPDAQAPRTTYANEIIDDTADEVTRMVLKIMEDGNDPVVQPDITGSTSLANRLIMAGIQKPSEAHIAGILRNMNFEKIGRVVTHACDEEGDSAIRQHVWAKAGLRMRMDIPTVLRARIANHKILEGL